MIRTKDTLNLPQIPEIEDKDTKVFLQSLVFALENMIRDIKTDLEQGESEHRVLSSVPSATDIDEGTFKLYESGATRRLYTKINGTVRKVDLS